MVNVSRERWDLFSSIALNENLNLKEKGLLFIILRYVNYETGYANPSRNRMKKLTGIVDNRTLENLLNSIISKGYLIREKVIDENNRYYIKTGEKLL